MARAYSSLVAGITLAIALTFSNSSSAVVAPLKQPSWVELTPQQREILAPLSTEWDKLESYRRKKWLGIAQRYPAMSAEEQERLQRRMKTWANLSPEERKRAREQYKTLKKAPPEQRQVVKQKWELYNSLPPEEKERMKRMAILKPKPKSVPRQDIRLAPAAKPATAPPPAAIPVAPVAPSPAAQ